MKYLLTAIMMVAGAALGCGQSDNAQQTKAKAAAADSPEAVAKIGERAITMNEIMESIEATNPRYKALIGASPDKLKEYIDGYVNQEVLYLHAEKQGVGNSEEVQKNLATYKKRLMIRNLTQTAIPKQFSDDEIKKYYDEHSDLMVQVKVSQLLITANTQNGVTKQMALEKANKAYERASAGEDFAKLVRELSDDPRSKRQGGDMGYVGKGRFPANIESVLFSLKEGEVSKPIEVQRGYVIVKVTGGIKPIPFDQVKGKIQTDLRTNFLNDYIANLKKEFNVVVFEDTILKQAGASSPEATILPVGQGVRLKPGERGDAGKK